MKTLFGESAATALLAGSLIFYPQSLTAETIPTQDPTQSQQEKLKLPVPQLGAELAPETPVVQLPASKSVMVDLADAPPPFAPSKAKPGAVSIAHAATSQTYVATAYSLRGRTASGRFVARGIIAADRSILPLGTRVRLDAGAYSGEYLVADTGGAVRGRKIDVWMSSNGEALRFGRRKVKLTVLSYGGRRAVSRKG